MAYAIALKHDLLVGGGELGVELRVGSDLVLCKPQVSCGEVIRNSGYEAGEVLC